MSNDPSFQVGPSLKDRKHPWLERITAAVLLLVIAALGWIILAAFRPEWNDWASQAVQVLVILALLSAALILVSVVALLHTRS